MSALTKNTDRPVRIPPGGLRTEKVKLAGYTNRAGGSVAFTVYKGAVVVCDITDTDGYYGPNDITYAQGDIFGGIAAERQDVAAADADDGSVELTVHINGIWGFPKASLAITDIGALIYATNTNDVTTTSTNAALIGRLVDVDDTYAWINIEQHVFVPLP